MNLSTIESALRRIETLARHDPGNRGLASQIVGSHIHAAASDLLTGQRVILITGFCVRAAMIGETDGPPGTLALADALRQLGKTVVLVTDRFSEALLTEGAKTYGEPFATTLLGLSQDEADRTTSALLDSFKPSHVVAIERPGSASDGHRYSMRGEILDDVAPAADGFLPPPAERGYRTLAVGDGGNELGFGSERETLKDKILHGDLIFCTTPADYLIPAGISNWGAYALAAALSILSGRLLIKPSDNERVVLQAMCDAGAVDGCTRLNELTVDGQAWDDYAATLDAIYAETRAALEV